MARDSTHAGVRFIAEQNGGAYAWLPALRRLLRAARSEGHHAHVRRFMRSLLTRLRTWRDTRLDRRLNIRTTSAPVNGVTRHDRNNDSVHYEPLHYGMLFRVLKDLRLSPDDVVYDVGSGLGRMLFACASAGARRCIGIELSTELASLAQQNASRFRSTTASIDTRNEDAANADYAAGTIYLLHNPFGERTLRAVLHRIYESILDNPRDVRIVYIVPKHEHVLTDCGWLTLHRRRSFLFSRVEATYWKVAANVHGSPGAPHLSKSASMDHSSLRTELISGEEGIRAIQPAWKELHRRVPDASPHRSDAWAIAHLDSGALHGQPCALIVRRDEEAVALLPGERRTICGAEVIRPLGTGIPGSLGVLCDPSVPEAIGLLADAIMTRGWDVLQFNDLDQDDLPTLALRASLEARGARVEQMVRTRTHMITLERDFESHLERTKPARRRRKLRHEWRALERSADVRIERYHGISIAEDLIERIVAIQTKSWLHRRGAARLGDGLHRQLLRATSEAGMLRAWILTLDGADAAFVLAIRGGATLHYTWTAFDLRYQDQSVGKYLTARVLEDACLDGFATLDFGQGEAEYKAFWATGSYNVERLAIGCTLRGRLLSRAIAWSWRIRRWRFIRRLWRQLEMRRLANERAAEHRPICTDGVAADSAIHINPHTECVEPRRAA